MNRREQSVPCHDFWGLFNSEKHVLKEQHQRVISWWEREWNHREKQNRVTPILETVQTWLTSKITTENISLLHCYHQVTDYQRLGNVQSEVSLSAHLLSPTLSLSIQHWSLLRVGYSNIPTLSGSLYSSREGDKRQLQPNCLIFHTRTILKSLCSHAVRELHQLCAGFWV